MSELNSSSWRNLVTVASFALMTVVGADFLLRQVCPPLPPRVEFAQGFSEFVASQPDILVLGSSHARAYLTVRDVLLERTSGAVQMAVLPLEWGKLSSYRWVIDHRIAPYLTQDRKSTKPRTSQLRHLVLVTEWWDGCSPGNQRSVNIPARAWTLGHFFDDVSDQGLNDFNRSYLTAQWGFSWRWTILISDRGIGRLPRALWAWVHGVDGLETAQSHQSRVEWWQNMTESAFSDPNCTDNKEIETIAHIVAFAKQFGLELTVVLHPRMPSTLTSRSKSTTLARFATQLQQQANTFGFRLVDQTTTSPLQDGDFMSDFDHVTQQGAAKLANWALSDKLAFLLHPDSPSMRL